MTSPASSAPTLKRDLGLRIAFAVVVGNVIGSGIFLKPGTIAAASGNFWLIITVWVLGGVLCLLGALCFAELATLYPRAGGMYVYLREAYGKLVAFLFGWTETVFGKPAAIGALAVAFVAKLNILLSPVDRPFLSANGQVGVAIAAIALLAWINILGVVWGGRMQLLTTIIKAGFLALVGVLPFLLIPFVSNAARFENYQTTVTPDNASLAAQMGTVLLAVMWAYNGWHGITPLAEEVRQPQRNLPIALFGGIGILIVLYVTANFAYHGVLSMDEMKAAGQDAAENTLLRLLGPWGSAAMSAVIMCSVFGAINSNLLQAPRVTYAMGRDQVFFRGLGQVHANYRTPVAAIVLMAGMAIGLVLAAALSKSLVQGVDARAFSAEIVRRIIQSLQDGSIFDLLTNFVIFSASIFYVLAVTAVVVLRWRQPESERPYRTWGYPITPILFLGVYCWFLDQVLRSNPLESYVGLAFIAIGVPFYFGYRLWNADSAGTK